MEHNLKRKLGLLSGLLALALLAGCGGGTPSGGASKAAPRAQTEAQESEMQEPETEEAPAAFRPVVGTTTESDFHYDEDLQAYVNSMETELAGVDAATREAYPELADALDRLRENALSLEREAYEEREAALMEDVNAGKAFYGEMRSLVRRADAQAVSIVNAWSEYAGEAHPSYGYATYNFDTETGEEIALESLLTDEGKLELNSRLGHELDALYPDLAPGSMIADYLPDDYAFSLEPDGVTFWFNPNTIASYAYGLFTVKLHFEWDDDILNGAYKGEEEAWFAELVDDVPYWFATADGEAIRTAEFWEIASPDDSGWLDGFGLEFDAPNDSDRWEERPRVIGGEYSAPEGRNIVLDDTGHFDARAYYARIPEGDFVVVVLSMENDAQEVVVYRADGTLFDTLSLTGPDSFSYPELPENWDDIDDWSNYDFYRISLTDPYNMPLNTRVDLFGTWSAEGAYRLAPSGVELIGELLYNSGDYKLTLKQDLTVERCPSDSWLDIGEEEATLPAGTEVQVVAVTETRDRAFFRVPALDDGAEFAFSLSYDGGGEGWPRTVNGVNEADIFDGLTYAG